MQLTDVYQYYQYYLNTLNNKLYKPDKLVKSSISLNMDFLPEFLKQPLHFIFVLGIIILMVFYFMSEIFCVLLGVVYPIYCCFNTLIKKNQDQMGNLTKYLIIYNLLFVIDYFLFWIISCIPFYHYFKLGVIYALIRNNYQNSQIIFDELVLSYQKIDLESIRQYWWLWFQSMEKKKVIKKDQ